MNGWKWLFLWITIVVLLVLWLFTGGVAIQDVQRFEPIDHEGFRVSLEGSVSQIDIPFLFSSYSAKGPFRVCVAYHNSDEEKVREVRLRSVNVAWHGQPVQLVVDGPVVLPVRTKQYSSSRSSGIVSITLQEAEHSFAKQLDIPFHVGMVVDCDIDAELDCVNPPRQIKVSGYLRGGTLNFIRTYWEHLAGC
jgi:hypothetical protein